MTQSIVILSVIPRLSYHLRIQFPNLTIFDVLPDKFDTLSKLQSADIVVADCDLFLPYTVGEKLKMFGATIWEVMRTPLKENLNYLDKHGTIARLSEMLKNCDYIINVLPSTSSTLGLSRNIYITEL